MMDIYSSKGKQEIINRYTPKTKTVKNCILAFLVGGALCTVAEMLRRVYIGLGLDEKNALTTVSITFILLASVLTAIGVFDRIARFAGAGTLVPITGFSNSVTSQAIDARSEGFILGVGAKIFTVAGPVILYGLSAGVVYGVIYYTVSMFTSM